MAEGDVDVVLKDEEERKAGETPPEKTAQVETPETTDDVGDGIEELKRKLEEANQRATLAEQRASEAAARAGQAETTAYGSQMAVIQSGLDTIKSNREILTRQASEAMAAGDFDKASEIQAQIAEQAAVKLDLEKGKAALETQMRQPPRQAPADDPVERYIQTLGPNSDRAATWLRAHRDYVTDSAKNQQLLRMHHSALGEGHVQGSEGYFGFIETRLGMRGNGHAQEREEVASRVAPAREEPTSAAAQVVSRRDDVQPSPAPTSRGGGSRKVALNRLEQEAAEISGQTYEEYARAQDKEKKAGNLIYTYNQRKH